MASDWQPRSPIAPVPPGASAPFYGSGQQSAVRSQKQAVSVQLSAISYQRTGNCKTSCQRSAVSYQRSGLRSKRSAVSDQHSAIGIQRSAISEQQSISRSPNCHLPICQLLAARCLLPAAHWSSAFCPLPAANCQLVFNVFTSSPLTASPSRLTFHASRLTPSAPLPSAPPALAWLARRDISAIAPGVAASLSPIVRRPVKSVRNSGGNSPAILAASPPRIHGFIVEGNLLPLDAPICRVVY